MPDLTRSETLGLIVSSGHSVYAPPVPDGCGQIFTECSNPECERPCGAHRMETPVIEIIDARVYRISERVLIAAIIIFAILGGIVGQGAVDRQERAHQSTERV